MVVPLIPDTEASLVRRIEGRGGAVLQPLETIRLPVFAGAQDQWFFSTPR
ncbi:hypothetical protein Vqi01_59640 [Micromonospora qiuiae]|uniref:Uncharacterized protein n=1 Tax=Micromonospora qiuiae TaxID=502268 RepID=A0ABQ4JMS6_9ACTN|nr:hypothetical protein [Micromonospora qiuiae]GIJ30802.1 hypothetical protein Vqi01_59640 [Micromonospora qiuiae]